MSEIEITTDKTRLDMDFIAKFLQSSYWATDRTNDEIRISVENSICFAVFYHKKQIGFARVLSDHAVYAYLMDVFIDEDYRGNGYSKLLMESIIDYAPLEKVKQWALGTRDAHGLYEKYGFVHVGKEENLMRLQK